MNFAKEDKGTACSFADVPQNMWYYGAVAGATENGWISGSFLFFSSIQRKRVCGEFANYSNS